MNGLELCAIRRLDGKLGAIHESGLVGWVGLVCAAVYPCVLTCKSKREGEGSGLRNEWHTLR